MAIWYVFISSLNNIIAFFFSPCLETNWYSWRITGKAGVLSWIQRLKIAIDSATGLWFLHTYPEGCIIHRDIKVNFFLEAGIIYFTFYSQSLFNCFFIYTSYSPQTFLSMLTFKQNSRILGYRKLWTLVSPMWVQKWEEPLVMLIQSTEETTM